MPAARRRWRKTPPIPPPSGGTKHRPQDAMPCGLLRRSFPLQVQVFADRGGGLCRLRGEDGVKRRLSLRPAEGQNTDRRTPCPAVCCVEVSLYKFRYSHMEAASFTGCAPQPSWPFAKICPKGLQKSRWIAAEALWLLSDAFSTMRTMAALPWYCASVRTASVPLAL